MPNQANLEATLAAIEANPQHWEQAEWHCGTSHCFGGFAEMLRLGKSPTCQAPLEGNVVNGGLLGRYATQDWLGLEEDEWDEITDLDNSLDDIRRMVCDGQWYCHDYDEDE